MSTPARPILRSSVLTAGTGTPVLMLHGSVSSGVMWTPVINVLKSRFRVLAPDLIGYGRTDAWPPELEFGLEDEVRLIEPLVAHEPAHVVAHSYGAVVALQLARSGRVPLRSLTLIEPVEFHVLRASDDREAWAEVHGFGERYLARIAAGDTETALREFVDFWQGAGAWDAMDETGRAQMRRAAAKLACDFRATFADPGPDPWSRIRLPVRLLAGDKSPLVIRRLAATLAKRLPAASLQVVAGADHFLPMTHHELLAEILLEKLSK
jgi:pimeloyl-ACP methyl ester carboxylesterase